MIRTILIALLTVGVIGVGYWGYKEHEDKNALLIQAENTYQRSFHELSYNMDVLHDKIGTSLAMNSGERLSPQFVDIWRTTSQALSNVSELPLSLMPFHETKEFLSTIGEFTYQTAIRNLDDDPLSEDEISTLEQLHTQAEDIKDELREMQHTALDDNLRWMDVELALATQSDEENTIIDGLHSVEDKIGEFATDNQTSDIMQLNNKEAGYQYITGDWKSEEAVKDFAQNLFSIKDPENIVLAKSGEGADVPIFTVSYEDGKTVYMDITQKGAHPLSLLVERPVEKQKISLNDGLLKAEKYLKDFDYDNMVGYESQQFDNIGVYSFAFEQDDVRLYPDTVVIKVALDNGEIMGLNAQNYFKNHHERKLEDPVISLEEARGYVNEGVEIEEEQLVLLENNLGKEVMAYEFLGVMDDQTFRIFINAQDGTEEKVEKLSGKETNFEANL